MGETIYDYGNVKISPDVISAIAALAIDEIEGVSQHKKIVDKIVKNNAIKINIDENNDVSIEVLIEVQYGLHLPTIARRVQENIKSAIETMTMLKAVKVDICITSLNTLSYKNNI